MIYSVKLHICHYRLKVAVRRLKTGHRAIFLALSYLCRDNILMFMENPIDQASKNRMDIASIKRRYITGEITREEAKVLTQPIIARINRATEAKTKELNKKYGSHRKPVFLDFVNAMRNSY